MKTISFQVKYKLIHITTGYSIRNLRHPEELTYYIYHDNLRKNSKYSKEKR